MDELAAKISHLMRRAGFSCSPDELQQRVAKGLDTTLSELLHYEDGPDYVGPPPPPPPEVDYYKEDSIKYYWLKRMVKSPRPLQEKMVLFWHGHFATANFKVRSFDAMWRQNRFFRAHAVDDFRDLLLGVSRDPAMLVWLDSVANTKKAPNENYGREIMELFSLGLGNYTEADIKAAARAFSGWQVKDYVGWVDVRQHDFSTKTFLGVSGRLNGDDVVDIIVKQPACARFLSRKLLRFFATQNPSDDWVERISTVYFNSERSVRAMVEAIFRSPDFYTPGVMRSLYKSPVEYVASVLRESALDPPDYLYPNYVRTITLMGQSLLNPPTVKGWDGNSSWVNTSTLLARINFAKEIAALKVGPLKTDTLVATLTAAGVTDADGVLNYFVNQFGAPSLAPETRDVLLKYLNSSSGGVTGPFRMTKLSADVKVRNLIRLLLSAPEYQLH